MKSTLAIYRNLTEKERDTIDAENLIPDVFLLIEILKHIDSNYDKDLGEYEFHDTYWEYLKGNLNGWTDRKPYEKYYNIKQRKKYS